jgi:nucleoside-diphosphate-sugar epimerase
MRNKKILITGITGFLGSKLAIELVNNGYEVIALKRKSSSLARIECIEKDVQLYNIEEIDYANVFEAHHEIDFVIHTATAYGRNNESPWEIFEANTGFPLKLLDAASNANVKKFINTDTILDKYLNLYSLSKNHLLEWGKFYSMKNKIEFINMRLEHFYGSGDDNSKFTSFVINKCIANEDILQLTPGEQKRDFIYIDDVVSAYMTVLEKTNINKNKWFDEYDVGSGNSVTIKEFVQTVHRLTNSKIELNFGALPYRKSEVMSSSAEIKGLLDLGWACKYNLEEGLMLTINK